MRDVFSQWLVRACQADERIIVLTGDHGYSLFDDIRRECPDQYLNAGVAEQNLIGVAAGLAKGGFRPITYGLGAFIPIRVLEQIKLDICYEALPVVLIGDGAGIVYSTLGASHQCTEDIAALRAVPNISLFSPADDREMSACLDMALHTEGPCYVRIGKADRGTIHEHSVQLHGGRLLSVRTGAGPLAWIATGSMVQAALAVAPRWPGSAIWSAPAIKPLDIDHVVGICRKHQAVIVLEEHCIYGGLGSAIAEIASEHAPTWVCRIGIRNRFSEKCGSYGYLLSEHGLDTSGITAQVQSFLGRINYRSAVAA
jgi:transketolase